MPSWLSKNKTPTQQPRPVYSGYTSQFQPQTGKPAGGGAYAADGYAPQGNQPRADGRPGGLLQGSVVANNAGPTPTAPTNHKQAMRELVKRIKQEINEQKTSLNELKREVRKVLASGDNEGYAMYLEGMVRVRLFMRRLEKVVINVNLIGLNMNFNKINHDLSHELKNFLKMTGDDNQVDMDEVTREYFDKAMSLESSIDTFIQNMKDNEDREGNTQGEYEREKRKFEAEFGRRALNDAPELPKEEHEAHDVANRLNMN